MSEVNNWDLASTKKEMIHGIKASGPMFKGGPGCCITRALLNLAMANQGIPLRLMERAYEELEQEGTIGQVYAGTQLAVYLRNE